MPAGEKIPRGLSLALAFIALLWAVAAAAIAQRSAHGIAGRFNLDQAQLLLSTLFFLFLYVLGLQMLDWLATRRADLREAWPLPTRPGWVREWGIGAALGWGLCIAAVLPVLLSGNLHGHLRLGTLHAGAIVLGAATLLAVALAEEILFRGYAFIRLIEALGPGWASVISSTLFAAILAWSNFPFNFLTAFVGSSLFGIILAMAYLRTRGLWLSWGLHFAYRAVMLLVLGLPAAGRGNYASLADGFATGPRWLTGGAYGLDAAWLTIPILLLAMPVLFRVTRDYAWHYTFQPIIGAGEEVTVPPPPAHAAMEAQAAQPAALVQILARTSQSPVVPPPPPPPTAS